MTVTQRVNLVRNAEEHIRALTAVIDLLVQSPDCQHELAAISRALSWLAFRAQPHDFGNVSSRRQGMTMFTGLAVIEAPHFTAGVVVERDQIAKVPPILGYMGSWSYPYLKKFVTKHHWRLAELSNGMLTHIRSGASGTGWATAPSNVPTTGSYSRRCGR
jgi:hypothetical protein